MVAPYLTETVQSFSKPLAAYKLRSLFKTLLSAGVCLLLAETAQPQDESSA